MAYRFLSIYPRYLILDDHQIINHLEIHDGLSYLLNHTPASLHVIIGSRSQLPVALGRRQMQDQLVEIRHGELRFNVGEASSYFAQSATTLLKQPGIQQAITLTEGWIAQHNLFLSILDEAGFWFRYHPLMRGVLQSRLQLYCPNRQYMSSPLRAFLDYVKTHRNAGKSGDIPVPNHTFQVYLFPYKECVLSFTPSCLINSHRGFDAGECHHPIISLPTLSRPGWLSLR